MYICANVYCMCVYTTYLGYVCCCVSVSRGVSVSVSVR